MDTAPGPQYPPSRQFGRTIRIGAVATVATLALFVVAWTAVPDDIDDNGVKTLLSVWGILAVVAFGTTAVGPAASSRWRPVVVGIACGFLLGSALLFGFAMWALSQLPSDV